MTPLLTIGVPVYNGAETLDRCLGSIAAYAPEDVQVIVSDNASTDGTEAIGRDYATRLPNFRYVRQAVNVGGKANFCQLFETARTPYFMWLGDDDWLGDDFVERALAFMERHPDYVLATIGASAYYSSQDGEYQFTTLTSSVEDEDPRRRVELFLKNLTDNSEFYGIYRRAAMHYAPPEGLGGDWITMVDASYLGKIRAIAGTVLHRQNRWDSPTRHAAIAASAGLPAAQGAEPHYATALVALVHVAFESPVYAALDEDDRLALAASVLRGLRQQKNLGESIRFWPDARRLFGDAFARRHGAALRATIGGACRRALDAGTPVSPEVVELALVLNLGGETEDTTEDVERAAPEADSLAMLALRALHAPAYRQPRLARHESLPHHLAEEHVRFLTMPQYLFEAEADVEAYAAHQLRAIESLLPTDDLDDHLLRVSPYRVRLMGVLMQRLYMIPCYFAAGPLRTLMEKRARLGALWLRQRGVPVDAEIPGGAAGARLRVGLLLTQAVSQTDAPMAFPALAGLDRSRFETVALVTQLVKGGSPEAARAQKYALGLAERAVVVQGGIGELVAGVREQNLDFLLIGNNITAVSHALFFASLCRLARWQVAFSPCCTTTGSANVDFFVSSAELEARGAGQAGYSERLLTIQGPGHVRMVPPFEAELGVPGASAPRTGSGIRLVSGANYYKLTPRTRATWMRLLATLPEATLSLYPFGPAWSSQYDAGLLQRVLARDARAAGVDIARVHLLDAFPTVNAMREFLGTMDLYLDSFPFSGVNSVLDPLMAGLPVVTLAGDSFRSNLGASVLNETGFPEWVAATPERYVSIVCGLVSDAASLGTAKQRVYEAMQRGSRFFDSPWYSAQFAKIFEDIAAGRPGHSRP
jgi:hypothetical protein